MTAMGLVWRRSRQWETAAVRRRRAAVSDDLPHVVDLMVAALSAGADPGEALTRVARVVEPPTAEELSTWVSRLALGTDPVTVWDAMAHHPELGRLGLALRRSAESGAPVTKALSRLAEDLRSRAGAEVEARVRQVEVKAAVPLGVCLLPSFVLVGVVPLVAGSVLGFLTG
jgi:Flp pilus assembly protein TadB